jgi:hypothetical protein
MKKYFSVIALLVLSFSQLRAQEGIIFKIKYLPGHTYQTTTNLKMKVLVNLNGNKEVLDKLKSQGIKQPVNADVLIGFKGNINSGALSADNSFPVNIEYKIDTISVNANGRDLPIPQKENKDVKLYGHVTPDGQLKIDSANGKRANDSTEKKMQQMMNLIQKEIQFPNHPLKPGDTFTQGMPINIPVKGNDINVDAKVIYKLVSVSDGKAYFDMVQNLNVNFQMKKGTVNVTGNGTGKMVYSIKDNFPISTNGNFNMQIKANMDKLNVDGTATISTDHTAVIN